MAPGTFILPDPRLEPASDPAKLLGIDILSGFRAADQSNGFRGMNAAFDAILDTSASLDLKYEDQCSSKYYFDLVCTLDELRGEYGRVVEVGVFMGGSTSVLAGCMTPFGFDMDLVDLDLNYLHFSYERVRRLYPEAAKRIRLFHGDLSSYVRAAIDNGEAGKAIVHHDGAHNFDQVVRDMAALSFIEDRLCAIIAQDTHLRGRIHHMNFVDMAMYAVFGLDLQYVPIGANYMDVDLRTQPNAYEGNYFMPDAPEGFVLPMDINSFRYPHPGLRMDDFLPLPALRHAA